MNDYKFDWEGDKPNEFNFDWIETNSSKIKNGYPFITINPKKNNKFYINSNAIRTMISNIGFDEINHLQVGVDVFNKALALKPMEVEIEGSIILYARSKDRKEQARYFVSYDLMDRIRNIVDDETKRYRGSWNNKIKALVIDLSESISPWKR